MCIQLRGIFVIEQLFSDTGVYFADHRIQNGRLTSVNMTTNNRQCVINEDIETPRT